MVGLGQWRVCHFEHGRIQIGSSWLKKLVHFQDKAIMVSKFFCAYIWKSPNMCAACKYKSGANTSGQSRSSEGRSVSLGRSSNIPTLFIHSSWTTDKWKRRRSWYRQLWSWGSSKVNKTSRVCFFFPTMPSKGNLDSLGRNCSQEFVKNLRKLIQVERWVAERCDFLWANCSSPSGLLAARKWSWPWALCGPVGQPVSSGAQAQSSNCPK